MNKVEKEMITILKELHQNYGVTAVKASLEAEGIRFDELLRTKEIIMSAGVGLTVKLGGCEALTDLRMTKMIGANAIMAPMIESKFALEKFLDMAAGEYAEEELQDINVLINIETEDGHQKLDKILQAENITALKGIVLGRTDLAKALKATDVNAPEMLTIARDIFEQAKQKSLICIVGGGITPKSIPFLTSLDDVLDGFETRKVVFANYSQAKLNMEAGIKLALQFEYHWYELKQNYYGTLYKEDASKMKGIAALLGL